MHLEFLSQTITVPSTMVMLWKGIIVILISIGLNVCFVAQTVDTDTIEHCIVPPVAGYVTFDDVSRNNTHRVIQLWCDEEHHSFLGDDVSTCNYDVTTGETTWLPNPSEFTCFAYCTIPDIHPPVTVHDDEPDNKVQRLHLECPHDYTSSGGSIITCVYNGTTQQTSWQPDPFDFTCHTPCTLQNLQEGVESSPENTTVIWHGEDVSFSCTKGKLLGPERSRCHDGQWIPLLTQRCDFDQGRVRLYHGRVMVRYNGLEGSICSTEEWDIHNANVVCRQLGFRPYAISVTSIPFFNIGNDIVHFDSVRCEGYESELIDCGLSFSPCHTRTYAGVVCLEADETASEWSVRLINPLTNNEPSSGRVEVYRNGRWGSICINDWARQSGHVVCRQLGYKKAVNISTGNTNIEGMIHLDRLECTGDEKSIKDCPHTVAMQKCEFGAIETVVCEIPDKYSLRLINGTSSKDGRLEIFDGAHWRAVSDTFQHDVTPNLICDELVEEGSYRTHVTDGMFGIGVVAPKYSYACPKDATDLGDCMPVDVRAYVTDERPISLYCDKVEVPPSTNPQLILLLTFGGALILVVIGFLIRMKYHNKRVLYRQRSIISSRYDHLPDQSEKEKEVLSSEEITIAETCSSDSVFKE